MPKLLKLLEKLITKIEESPFNITAWVVSFTAIIAVRILIEGWISGFKNKSSIFIFYEFTHNFLFFLISFLLFLFLLNKLLKIKLSKLSNVILWGFLIILTPPIIDNIISRGAGFWSFYKFDGILGLIKRFFTFFGDKPEIGITYGVRFEVATVTILLAVYVFLKIKFKTRKNKSAFFYSLITALFSYVLFFILGTFPSYVTIFLEGIKGGFMKVNDVDVAQMFLTPISLFSREISEITSVFNFKMSMIYVLVFSFAFISGLFLYQKEKFFAFLKNIRPPQIIYHLGLLLAGLGLEITATSSSIASYFNFFNIIGFIILAESVILAWLASVVVNDIVDQKIDEKTNNSRPLIQKSFSEAGYRTVGILLFLSSLLFASIVNVKFALLLAAYQAIAWLYSAWPLRLKRFAFVSTFASAIASLLIFFGGYILSSPNQDLAGLPKTIIILLISVFTLSLPIKDFKDIEGDKEDGIYTIPVLFGEYWGKIIVGAGIFLSFLLSVLLLNEFHLFWWAIIFGGISFWLVNKMRPTESSISLVDLIKNPELIIKVGINYQNIFWWILLTVSLYGIILVKIIFLK
jgi:4-hydroxybenzoate polyprenyltransferase